MGSYIKWLLIGVFLLLIIIGLSNSQIRGLPFAIIYVIGLILLFYLLDKEHFVKKKSIIENKLINIFKAETFSEDVMKFKMGTFDFYTEINKDSKFGIQLAVLVIINFHIPKDQIDRLSNRPEFVLTEDQINGMKTYIVHQTSINGLKPAKKKLEEMTLKVK